MKLWEYEILVSKLDSWIIFWVKKICALIILFFYIYLLFTHVTNQLKLLTNASYVSTREFRCLDIYTKFQKKDFGFVENFSEWRKISAYWPDTTVFKISYLKYCRRIWKISLPGKYPVLQAGPGISYRNTWSFIRGIGWRIYQPWKFFLIKTWFTDMPEANKRLYLFLEQTKEQ